MIFRRSIVTELSSNAGAVFTVLFSIVLSVGLVRILGEAAGGRVDNQAVFSLVALTSLTWLPMLLTLTLFIAVLITLTRAFRDSEMVIWFASGQSLLSWVRPVLRFGLPIIVLIGLLALFATPWAQRQMAESRAKFAQRDDVSRVAPGRFIESGSADRVFFVENVDIDGGTVRSVFVSDRRPGRETVVVAAEGVIEVRPEGDRYLVLSRGRRYEGVPGKAEYRMTEFERFAIRIESRPDAPLQEIKARAKSTRELIKQRSPFNDAELAWRIGMPLVALLLAVLAIPLAWTNPRLGRSANLLIAIMVFFLYHTSLQMMQANIQLERLSFRVGVWLPHAVALGAIVLLMTRRVYLQRWLPRFGRRARAEPAA